MLEAIIGPDVLALQTMLFFKQPGQPGQGYHQDSYYIPTLPDTLCGAWLALEPATEENGCMWMVAGSQCEPIYPDLDGVTENGDWGLGDIEPIAAASHPDESLNRLARVARKYAGREVKVEAQPGDVVFFNGHILHRSHANRSATQSRHAFVGPLLQRPIAGALELQGEFLRRRFGKLSAYPCTRIDAPAFCATALRYPMRGEPPRPLRHTPQPYSTRFDNADRQGH